MAVSNTESVSTTNAGLTILFSWNQDRYEFQFQSDAGILAATIDDQIETPVFADLLQQEELTFLSGLSDDRHWSMSVEPIDRGYALDIACRAKSAVNLIGTVFKGETEPFEVEGVNVQDAEAPTINRSNRIEVVAATTNDKPPLTVHYRFEITLKD